LSQRHALEVFELDEDGAVGYSEVGSYDVAPMRRLTEAEMDDPIGLIRKLAPGQEVPSRLLELASRRRRRGVRQVPEAEGRLTTEGPLPSAVRTPSTRGAQPPRADTAAGSSAVEVVAQAVEHRPSDGVLGDR
jgi:hypothetical protein